MDHVRCPLEHGSGLYERDDLLSGRDICASSRFIPGLDRDLADVGDTGDAALGESGVQDQHRHPDPLPERERENNGLPPSTALGTGEREGEKNMPLYLWVGASKINYPHIVKIGISAFAARKPRK